MHVLFVCTSSSGLSPLAERLTAAFAADHGAVELTADSAGAFWLLDGRRCPRAHRARRERRGILGPAFTPALAERAILVRTMER